MKKLIIIACVLLGLYSCKKENIDTGNNNNNLPPATYDSSFIRFVANGTFTEIKTSPTVADGASIDSTGNALFIYYANRLTGSSSRTYLMGYGNTSGLALNVPYTYTRTAANNFSSVYWKSDNFIPDYGMEENNTAHTCTITKMKNLPNGSKAINGTFTAKLANATNTEIMTITNGEFFDIRTK